MRPAPPPPPPPRARGSCSRTVSQNMTSTRAWPCSWCEGQGALQPGSRASTQGFIVSIHHRERFLGSPRRHLGCTTLRVSEQSRPPLGGNILISCWLCSLTAAGRPSSPVCWPELQLQGGWAGLGWQGDREYTAGAWLSAAGLAVTRGSSHPKHAGLGVCKLPGAQAKERPGVGSKERAGPAGCRV